LKTGVLNRNTYLHTGNVVVKIRRGTRVHADGRVLTFPEDGMRVIRADGGYYALLWGSVRAITLPKGGTAPYPLSMI
jgi:hypothetical protein